MQKLCSGFFPAADIDPENFVIHVVMIINKLCSCNLVIDYSLIEKTVNDINY